MDRPTTGRESAAEPAGDHSRAAVLPIAEPRQRWRIVFARDAASDRPHREIVDEWTALLSAAELPLPRGEGRPRPILTFAAPMLAGVAADRELADLLLARRQPIADVRPVVEGSMPAELRLVDVHDVWLGAPALAAAVVAADYRVELAAGPAAEELETAATTLLSAHFFERERARGSGVVRYDLRPLVESIRVEAGPPLRLRIRTRFHPERGSGRPEEVVAALAELARLPAEVASTVRKRLILAGEEPTAGAG